MDPLDWQAIKSLEGRTLATSTRQRQFVVKRVSDASVVISPNSTNKERPIPREHLEAANRLRAQNPELRPSDLEKSGIVTHNPSYIVAVLRALEVG